MRILTLRLSALCVLVAGCVSDRHGPVTTGLSPTEARQAIEASLPSGTTDRAGWTADIYAALTNLSLEPSHEHICAVVAVIEQESGFRVDPVVPNLPAIAWREIDARAASVGIPRVILHGALQLASPTGQSYSERIDAARTEKDLSDIYQDFIGTVPLGRTLFADHDPIHTRGPMQVQVTFAEQLAAARHYPYPVQSTIANEVFTRRGGIYFGVAHLLAYPANYDRYLYRFADFNAGQYASRNAAFQRAVSIATRIALVPDGALLPHGGGGASAGATEAALRALAPRLGLDATAIHGYLEQGKEKGFEETPLYQRVFKLAAETTGHDSPLAAVPQIDLHGPKISRKLTTDWYANRVNGRFEHCLKH